jgi:hypothetical protein
LREALAEAKSDDERGTLTRRLEVAEAMLAAAGSAA